PLLAMASPPLLTVLMVVALVTGARAAASEENELDYGYWNYREGADRVNLATVRSVTRVLDAWGKRIFSEIKTLLHSQPSTLLPDYSRVRPLSESVNDLFREVSLLHRRITELNQRLASLQPVLHRFGYPGAVPGAPGGLSSTAGYGPPRGNRLVRRRLLRVQHGQVKVVKG
uniref:Si:ch211-243a20.3 n=1 Tax=Salarias fasciatus TaxID=181472 RepID=A0A672FQK6_SALFA